MPESPSPALSPEPGGVSLRCRVQPRASANRIAGLYGSALKIALTAPPVDGKANAALCEFLAELFGLPKSAVCIASGTASRDKRVSVAGITPDRAAACLSAVMK